MRVRVVRLVVLLGSASVTAGIAGCHDDSPPPQRVLVPSADGRAGIHDSEPMKPLPAQEQALPPLPPGFDDESLVNQRPPEQRAFVDAYNRVGRPKITVFVNRTMEGDVVPVNPNDPAVSVQYSEHASGGVTVERHDNYSHDGYYNHSNGDSGSKFQTSGPGEYGQTVSVYLQPGQYDEVQAKSLDYGAIETILTDWLSSNGQVTIISPDLARQRLSDEQVKELQSGRPRMLSEVAQQLGADILVQVQAHPTRQTSAGLEVRVVAEAVNTRGGESLGRAVVDITPPLEKTQINRYTRYLARKLMDDMAAVWASAPPPQPPGAPAAAPPPAATVAPPAAPAPPMPSPNLSVPPPAASVSPPPVPATAPTTEPNTTFMP